MNLLFLFFSSFLFSSVLGHVDACSIRAKGIMPIRIISNIFTFPVCLQSSSSIVEGSWEDMLEPFLLDSKLS